MVACIPITNEKVRAEIWMGDTLLLAKTPFVKSFSVNKSRNQVSNTFNITFEMLAGMSFPLGEKIVIKAGTRGNLKKIFTGDIEGTTSQPAFGKPSYFSVTLSGRGVLSGLENKKFSRRLKSDGQGLFCLITGGAANRPDRYYTLDKIVRSGNQTRIANSPNPARKQGEHFPLIVYLDTQANSSTGGVPGAIAGRPSGGVEGGAGGLTQHTHESLEEGGPAFGVYSSD